VRQPAQFFGSGLGYGPNHSVIKLQMGHVFLGCFLAFIFVKTLSVVWGDDRLTPGALTWSIKSRSLLPRGPTDDSRSDKRPESMSKFEVVKRDR
jgi:hypothetical protein